MVYEWLIEEKAEMWEDGVDEEKEEKNYNNSRPCGQCKLLALVWSIVLEIKSR